MLHTHKPMQTQSQLGIQIQIQINGAHKVRPATVKKTCNCVGVQPVVAIVVVAFVVAAAAPRCTVIVKIESGSC